MSEEVEQGGVVAVFGNLLEVAQLRAALGAAVLQLLLRERDAENSDRGLADQLGNDAETVTGSDDDGQRGGDATEDCGGDDGHGDLNRRWGGASSEGVSGGVSEKPVWTTERSLYAALREACI